MIKEEKKLSGPDLSKGVPFAEVPPEGMLLGHVANEEVLLVRSGGEIFAVSPHCTHYQGPLAEGVLPAPYYDALGITPASICAPARLLAHQPLMRLDVGRSNSAMD